MKNGKGKSITILHLYTDYKITDKPLIDLTLIQYNAVMIISDEIRKYKSKNKPLVVI